MEKEKDWDNGRDKENQTTETSKGPKAKNIALTTGKYIWLTFKWLFIVGIIAGFLVGGAGFGYVTALVKDDPVRSKETMMKQIRENDLTGFVYFRDDTVVGQLRSEEDRRLAELSEIPQVVLDAVFAIEDNNFYEHIGIDVKGTMRAVIQKLLKQDVQTGGSTITQQLARRVFLTLEKADSRKAKEILLSLRMERLMSKDEILLAYLNKIPYGNGSSGYGLYGIKAAAKGIFNIDDLSKLNIAQAAYLAGLPQQPSNYSTFTSKGIFDPAAFKRAKQRQELVLRRMLEENKITQQQYEEALAFDLQATLAPTSQKAYNTYPYLMMEVEKEAAKALLKAKQPDLTPESDPTAYSEALKNAQSDLTRGGYHVYTTIDKQLYDKMQEIAKDKNNFTPDDPVKGMEQVGAMMLDSKTGAILGMIEGRDFMKEQMNHATQAYRQPGSTMKPIAAFLPAMEMGLIQPASVIDDVPILLKDGRYGYHIPENWDDGYHGLVTARNALNHSYNIPAIRLFTEVVGIEKAWEFARGMGITSVTEEDYVAQTGVIGGLKYGTTVKEMTNAYATISNNGIYNEAFMIRKITDSEGKTVYEHELKPSTAFSEETAFLMTDMLRTVITSGTATDLMKKFNAYGKIPIAGKTGSTQDDADAWFIGYTPDITVGVWAGYESPVHKLGKAGQQRAKNIWALIMNSSVEMKPELFPTDKFNKPDNIVSMVVSSLSGKLPSAATKSAGKLTTDYFNKKYLPTEEDNVMVSLPIITYNGINYIAQKSTPADFVTQKIVVKRDQSLNALFKQIQEIMPSLPKSRQRPISFYKPRDYSSDAPSETDPRQDDGKAPSPPTTVVATNSGDKSTITFQASESPDVVGYRLYRSENRGDFKRLDGNVVLTGNETKFTDGGALTGVLYGYYVTAVDVAGNESVPSKAAYTDGTAMDLLFLTPDGNEPDAPSGGGQDDKAKDDKAKDDKPKDDGSGDAKPQAPPTAPPSAPTGLSVKANGPGVELKWKANPGKESVSHYVVYQSDKENGTYKELGTVKGGTAFRYYAAGADGYYRVIAVNSVGESKPSATVHFKKEKDN